MPAPICSETSSRAGCRWDRRGWGVGCRAWRDDAQPASRRPAPCDGRPGGGDQPAWRPDGQQGRQTGERRSPDNPAIARQGTPRKTLDRSAAPGSRSGTTRACSSWSSMRWCAGAARGDAPHQRPAPAGGAGPRAGDAAQAATGRARQAAAAQPPLRALLSAPRADDQPPGGTRCRWQPAPPARRSGCSAAPRRPCGPATPAQYHARIQQAHEVAEARADGATPITLRYTSGEVGVGARAGGLANVGGHRHAPGPGRTCPNPAATGRCRRIRQTPGGWAEHRPQDARGGAGVAVQIERATPTFERRSARRCSPCPRPTPRSCRSPSSRWPLA